MGSTRASGLLAALAALGGCGGSSPGEDANDPCDSTSCLAQCLASDHDDGYCTDGYCVCVTNDAGTEDGDDAEADDGAEESHDVEADLDADHEAADSLPTTCTIDDDCDDGRFCSGTERCVGGFCQPGEAPLCLDDTRCTEDRCYAPDDECIHTPRDMDGDGYPADHVLGEDCPGLDCDDTEPTVHRLAPELCDDGLDNDCDTLTDTTDPDCGG